MHTHSVSKVLAPQLVRPVVMHQGLIGYPDMGKPEYDRGGEQHAVRSLIARGYRVHQLVIVKFNTHVMLHVIAPHDLDVKSYETYVQAIVDGNITLDAHCGFVQFLAGLVFDGGAQTGPHGGADVWLDFTHAGEAQNAAFWTFADTRVTELKHALERLA